MVGKRLPGPPTSAITRFLPNPGEVRLKGAEERSVLVVIHYAIRCDNQPGHSTMSTVTVSKLEGNLDLQSHFYDGFWLNIHLNASAIASREGT